MDRNVGMNQMVKDKVVVVTGAGRGIGKEMRFSVGLLNEYAPNELSEIAKTVDDNRKYKNLWSNCKRTPSSNWLRIPATGITSLAYS